MAANAPANLEDNRGSHRQSRIVAAGGTHAEWWRQGVEAMIANRLKKLE